MQRLFAAVLAVTCVVGSTPGFARGGFAHGPGLAQGAGRGGFGRNPSALLAVPSGSGEYLYPACQFVPDGIIPGFEGVLHAFAIRNPWTQLSALLAPAPALAGMTILEALKSGRVENAIGVAASFGEQAA